MKLLMLKIGARPKGRLIEQHDVIFTVANSLSEVVSAVNQAWLEVKNKWHVDAWRQVTRVGDYAIELTQKVIETPVTDNPIAQPQLYFINLGGYLPNQFEEFHYKTLVVAHSVSQATAQARTTDFYRTHTVKNANPTLDGNATSHVDDKHWVDIDEIVAVDDLLPTGLDLKIRALNEQEKTARPEDTLHIGYLNLKQLKTLDTV